MLFIEPLIHFPAWPLAVAWLAYRCLLKVRWKAIFAGVSKRNESERREKLRQDVGRILWPEGQQFPWVWREKVGSKTAGEKVEYTLSYAEYFAYYSAIRTYIVAENTVLNFRISWTILFLGPMFNAIILLVKDASVKSAMAHRAFSILLYALSDAVLVSSFALWAGVFATTKVVFNLVKHWQEFNEDVILSGQDAGKKNCLPPIYSGRSLRLFGLLSRLVVALGCMAAAFFACLIIRVYEVPESGYIWGLDALPWALCVWMFYRPVFEYLRKYDKTRPLGHEHLV